MECLQTGPQLSKLQPAVEQLTFSVHPVLYRKQTALGPVAIVGAESMASPPNLGFMSHEKFTVSRYTVS